MKEIKAYKLTNGEIVSNEEEANKRQKAINFEESVYRFAEKHGYYEGKDQIRDAILENADELLDILNKR
jgi:adenylate kinase